VAHNGSKFDLPYLRSVALKYGLPPVQPRKLIDPVLILRQHFRIGSNSLAAVQNFLGLAEAKTPVVPDDWRKAVFSGSRECMDRIVEHCRADVLVLNEVAKAVSPYIGQIDSLGSFRR
jgi:uncharacterized protein YprB with RNaseH-like and TPR domain